MRRYFYFLTILIACSVFSQEHRNEVIGKWVIKDVSVGLIIGCPFNIEKFKKPIINTEIYFSETGIFYCTNNEYEYDFLIFNNSNWNINNDGFIEVKSLEENKKLKFKFLKVNGNYFLTFKGGFKFKIEKLKD